MISTSRIGPNCWKRENAFWWEPRGRCRARAITRHYQRRAARLHVITFNINVRYYAVLRRVAVATRVAIEIFVCQRKLHSFSFSRNFLYILMKSRALDVNRLCRSCLTVKRTTGKRKKKEWSLPVQMRNIRDASKTKKRKKEKIQKDRFNGRCLYMQHAFPRLCIISYVQ